MKKIARKILRDFYFGDVSENIFEKWLYQDNTLEKLFYDEYIDLISLDYKKETESLKAKEIVRKVYDTEDPELLFKHKSLEIAQGMLENSIPLELGCEKLADIYYKGMKFIPTIFCGFDSEFKDKDRNHSIDMLSAYSGRIKEECVQFIRNMQKYTMNI